MNNREKPPKSEISIGTGLVGTLSLGFTLTMSIFLNLPLFLATFLLLLGTAIPMVIWEIAVVKVHKNSNTGLDWSLYRKPKEILPIVWTKYVGLLGVFILLGTSYSVFKYYNSHEFQLYYSILIVLTPILICLTPIYLWYTTRHMTNPKDSLWHFGNFILLRKGLSDLERIKDYLRGWAIKGFFLAFLVSVFPTIVLVVTQVDTSEFTKSPSVFALFLIRILFLYDVCFAIIGYTLTLKPLNSHIRSANPYLGGWIAALICYPPFRIMGKEGILDYKTGGQEWGIWFEGIDPLLYIWGIIIVSLTFVYAWATVIFGIRFSNLTHRGIVTNGPFRYFKHPAYLSKNLFWWFTYLPFLTTVEWYTGIQNCLLLIVVNGIYYARAKTEEKHLMMDPQYRAYSDWISKNGFIPRMLSYLKLKIAALT